MGAPLGSLARNWKLKILAFGLALLLRVVVSAEQVTSDWIPVPLQVVVGDEDYRVRSSSVPSEVQVRFSGPGRELWDLAIRRPTLRLSIPEVEDTVQPFSLDPRMVHIPNELSVNANDVRPASVRLHFTRIDSRDVPVRVTVGQQLPAGWTLVDSLRADPATVRVTGPFGQLSQLSAIPTRPVILSARDTAFSRTVPLDTSGMGALELPTTRVDVHGRVDRLVERTIAGVPISIGPGVGVRPEEVQVVLRGAQSLVQRVTPQDLRVVVAIDSIPARIPATGAAVPLRVERIPPGLEAQTQPRTVRLLPEPIIPDSLTPTRRLGETESEPEPGR